MAKNNNLLYGFHMNKLPKLFDTYNQILSTDLTACQIYVANPQSIKYNSIKHNDLICTRSLLINSNKPLYRCIHGCLACNLAGSVNGYDDPQYNIKLAATRYRLTAELDV